jgi:hypothetical protein
VLIEGYIIFVPSLVSYTDVNNKNFLPSLCRITSSSQNIVPSVNNYTRNVQDCAYYRGDYVRTVYISWFLEPLVVHYLSSILVCDIVILKLVSLRSYFTVPATFLL